MRRKLKVIIPIIMAAIMLFIGGALFINTRANTSNGEAALLNIPSTWNNSGSMSTSSMEEFSISVEDHASEEAIVGQFIPASNYDPSVLANPNGTIYTNEGTSTSTGNVTSSIKDIDEVEVGDYIKYIPTKTSYSVDSSETGDFATQKFNPRETTNWIVYNTDNGVEIINEGSVGSLTLKGANGYKNAVAVLNELSTQYINSNLAKKARSIGSANDSIAHITSELEYGNNEADYADNNYEDDVNKIKGNNLLDSNDSIWLASRNFESDENWDKYFVRSLMSVGEFDDSNLYSISQYGTEQETAYTRGVKVVVTLKDDIQIISGDGSKENPYVLTYIVAVAPTELPPPITAIPTPLITAIPTPPGTTPRPAPAIVWDTTGQLDKEIKIKLNSSTLMDWGDNTGLVNVEKASGMVTLSHHYESEGTYYVTIYNPSAITYLDCSNSKVADLDMANFTALEYLICWTNKLNSLDLRKNTKLTYVHCAYNNINSLDISNNTGLTYFCCMGNKLTDLDVSKNIELKTFLCQNNQLKTLDISKNINLDKLYCSQETMTELLMDKEAATEVDKHENTKIMYLGTSTVSYAVVVTDDYKLKLENLPVKKFVDLIFADETEEQTYETADFNKNYVLDMENMIVECKLDDSKLVDAELLIDLPAFNSLKAPNNITNEIKSGNETKLAVAFESGKYVKANFRVIDTQKLLLKYEDSADDVEIPLGEVEVAEDAVVYDARSGKLSTMTFNALRTEVENEEIYVIPYTNKPVDGGFVEANILFVVGPKTIVPTPTPSAKSVIEFTWDTTGQLNKRFIIEFDGELNIDWGDNFGEFTMRQYPSSPREEGKTHTYESEGEYTVKVEGDKITKLTFPEVSFEVGCGVSRLDVSKALELKELSCVSNKLTSLDVSKNQLLEVLNCKSNKLTSLDVSKNQLLEALNCGENKLTSLNISQNTKLRELKCSLTKLTDLDVSKNTALIYLDCAANDLSNLDVKQNTALTTLRCYGNNLSSLDVSQNIALKSLQCNTNPLSSLDVSHNIALVTLSCYENNLNSLDVSQNISLENLHCDKNYLSSLDVSKNTGLTMLTCEDNKLSSLDVSENKKLKLLYCAQETMEELIMDINATAEVEKHENTKIVYKEQTSNWQFGIVTDVRDVDDDEEDDGIYCIPVRILFADGTTSREYEFIYNKGKEFADESTWEKDVNSLKNKLIVFKADSNKSIKYSDYERVNTNTLADNAGNFTNKEYLAVAVTTGNGIDEDRYRIEADDTIRYVIAKDSVIFNTGDGEKPSVSQKFDSLIKDEKIKVSGTIVYEKDSHIIKYLLINEKRENIADFDVLYAVVVRDDYKEKIGSTIKKFVDMIFVDEAEEQTYETADFNKNYVLEMENMVVECKLDDSKLADAALLIDAPAFKNLKDQNNITNEIKSGNETKLAVAFETGKYLKANFRVIDTQKLLLKYEDDENDVEISLGEVEVAEDAVVYDARGGKLSTMTFNALRAEIENEELYVIPYTNKSADGGFVEANILFVVGFKSSTPIPTPTQEVQYNVEAYTDVRPGDWYYDSEVVKFVTEKGYISGLSAKEFGPDLPMTRGQFISVLYNMAGKPEIAGTSSFKDVKSIHNVDAIVWGNKVGLMSGYPDGTFRPDASIDREQVVTVLKKYAEFTGINTNARANLTTFNDYADVYDWAYDAVSWAIAKGIMKGDNYNRILPHKSATRAEVSAILKNFETVK